MCMTQEGRVAPSDEAPATAHADDAAVDGKRRTAVWARPFEAVLLSRYGVVLSCAILIVLLGLNALVFYRTTQTLLERDRWVAHTQEVLAAINASMGALAAAENAQRGYILYGDPAYLRSFGAAARTVGPDIAQLRRVVSDNPDQSKHAAALVPLADEELADLELTITLSQSGQSAQAQDIVVRNRGAHVTEAIQSLFSTMMNTESALGPRRDAQARAAAKTTTVTLILATAVDAALLAGVLLAIQRLFARRTRLADERGLLLVEARQARASAEAAVKMRNDFLTVAAHDLRTPLTNMLGRAQLVETRLRGGRAVEPAWLTAQADSLVASTRRLLATVNELNDMIALERGEELDLSLEPVELSALARAVVDEVAPGLGSQSVGAVPIVIDAPAKPIVVVADRGRLARVLQNVIGNAVKYSVNGTPISVEVRRAGALAVVAVRDGGVGIPVDELPRIFERFYRASTARGIKGSGIGLAGAKASMEQHGGTISVQSAVGKGTTVTISLPVADAVENDDNAAGAIRVRPR